MVIVLVQSGWGEGDGVDLVAVGIFVWALLRVPTGVDAGRQRRAHVVDARAFVTEGHGDWRGDAHEENTVGEVLLLCDAEPAEADVACGRVLAQRAGAHVADAIAPDVELWGCWLLLHTVR
jgi:hypothetical protein